MSIEDHQDWGLFGEANPLVKRKKYGLVWEAKFEDVVEKCKNELPILEEVAEKEIATDESKPINFLIEGDNYHALSVLNYTHKGKVDVVYIDPPYNTGAKDWKYNNDYVDKEDAYRHSKWLSMMNHRLKLAKNVLKKDGVLICAIDENEQTRLGVLLQDIFNEKHYECHCISIIHNPRGVQGSNFSYTHEFAYFIFRKGLKIISKIKRDVVLEEEFKDHGGESNRTDAKHCFYPVLVKGQEIIGFGDVSDDNFHPDKNIIREDGTIEVYPIDKGGEEKKWVFARHTVEEIKDKLFVKDKGDGIVDIWRKKDTMKTKTVWSDERYDSSTYGSKVINKILPNNDFNFPKSLWIVYDCLSITTQNKKNAVILDFFAGSGTTGHAVMRLNKKDKGNRQFILCTNNENKIAEEVTYPIVGRIIEGYKANHKEKEILYEKELNIQALKKIESCFEEIKEVKKKNISEYEKFNSKVENNHLRLYGEKQYDGFKEGLGGNLKYFKTSFVPAEATDKNKIKLTQKAIEMLCIKENAFNKVYENNDFKIFKNNFYHVGIIFDNLFIDEFKEYIKKIDANFHIYIFSLEDDDFNDEFEDIKNKIKISPIPEAILRVYRRIFK